MTTKDEMLELAERCEKATGPDEALDEVIAAAVDAQPTGWVSGKRGHWTMWPKYTASLDAAMSLVPEGWAVRDLSDWTDDAPIQPPHWSVYLHNRGAKYSAQDGQAATPALALCAAALRARASHKDSNTPEGMKEDDGNGNANGDATKARQMRAWSEGRNLV